MRCDANISLKGGIRVEIKNISSFKEAERALNFEISRQKSLIAKEIKVKRETRHWDEVRRITVSLRTKEEEQDYRYFPEPDLVPITLPPELLDKIKLDMPELPENLKDRLVAQYRISIANAKILAENKEYAKYFEQCGKIYHDANEISNWVVGDLIPSLAKRNISLQTAKIPPESFCGLLKLLDTGQINRSTAKTVLDEAIDSGKAPAVQAAIKDPNAINYLVGLTMKATKGQADPKVINQVIRMKLEAG
jgi:aspartyl-tRNA(Asn)/glutamyl-tRNA(Gln) amidotransferase subunit B